jgi:hypothetical protein
MKAPSICYYVSDYGMGHAARSIAVIRRILAEWPDARITVKTDDPFAFMKTSLPSCVHSRTMNDIGVVLDAERPTVNREETAVLFSDWIRSWDAYIRQEQEFCRTEGIDCIISDIVPQVFSVASRLRIPGIAISNFSWHSIFRSLFGDTPEVKTLHDAYALADIALMLPFHEPMEIFPVTKEIGLISRAVTVSSDQIREQLGIGPDEPLIYLSTGARLHPAVHKTIQDAVDAGVRVLVSSHAANGVRGVCGIPDDEMETQNYLAACNLIVTKCGYSTISEAVAAGVPLLLYRREGFSEDPVLIAAVAAGGYGREILWDDSVLVPGGGSVSDQINMDGCNLTVKRRPHRGSLHPVQMTSYHSCTISSIRLF